VLPNRISDTPAGRNGELTLPRMDVKNGEEESC
jgi:hypothetical protein